MNTGLQPSNEEIEEWIAQAWGQAGREVETFRYARLAPELQRIYYNARDGRELTHADAVEMMEAALVETRDASE